MYQHEDKNLRIPNWIVNLVSFFLSHGIQLLNWQHVSSIYRNILVAFLAMCKFPSGFLWQWIQVSSPLMILLNKMSARLWKPIWNNQPWHLSAIGQHSRNKLFTDIWVAKENVLKCWPASLRSGFLLFFSLHLPLTLLTRQPFQKYSQTSCKHLKHFICTKPEMVALFDCLER